MQHQVHGNNEQVRFIMDCDELDGHFHSEMEVLYVLSGRMTIIDNNQSVSLGAEDFIVFNPYEHHEMIRESGCHSLSLFVPVPLLSQAGMSPVSCCSKLQPQLADYFPLIRVKLAMLSIPIMIFVTQGNRLRLMYCQTWSCAWINC